MAELIQVLCDNWLIVLILGSCLFGAIEHLIKVAQKRDE